jgi:general secretion pathway protein M
MNPMRTAVNQINFQLQNWLFKITLRERIMVISASIFAGMALIWLLLLNPLYSTKAKLNVSVYEKANLLNDLQQRAATLNRESKERIPNQELSQSIVLVIDKTARLRGLSGYLKRNQPDGNNKVRLRFENAPFDELVRWLNDVKTGHGLKAISASIDRSESPGRINCSLILERDAV